jgi:glutathione S-transferase
MKLYFSPGACSLASRISLHEAEIAADFERVDLKAKITERGGDFLAINPKGYVPVLVLDDGAVVTENIAILDLLTEREPKLGPGGLLGRTRLLEMLSYLSNDLHIAFKPFWHEASDAEKAAGAEAVSRRLDYLESQIGELYLFGPRFTVADAYLFVMLRWARNFGVPISTHLHGYFERVLERPAVRQALSEEALLDEVLAEESLTVVALA